MEIWDKGAIMRTPRPWPAYAIDKAVPKFLSNHLETKLWAGITPTIEAPKPPKTPKKA